MGFVSHLTSQLTEKRKTQIKRQNWRYIFVLIFRKICDFFVSLTTNYIEDNDGSVTTAAAVAAAVKIIIVVLLIITLITTMLGITTQHQDRSSSSSLNSVRR